MDTYVVKQKAREYWRQQSLSLNTDAVAFSVCNPVYVT